MALRQDRYRRLVFSYSRLLSPSLSKMLACFVAMESFQHKKICLITNLRYLPSCTPVLARTDSTRSEGRKYFDSGDFALSHAHRVSDIGHIRTGIEHPLRGSISHPLSPAPAGCNVEDVSNKQEKGTEDSRKGNTSNLHQQTSADTISQAQ
jgi:hypothetical protein